jgi:hypothetical protein
LGTIDSLTAFVGFALVLVSEVARALAGGPVLGSIGAIGFLAALIGLMSLGYVSQRAGVLPRWCGMLLSVGFPLSLVLGGVLWLTLGAGWALLADVLRGIIWALVGYALLSSGGASVRQPAARVS